jgi:glucosamine 6-phosphate synthetase-like amidotransferase/phosphosugar isomerase protein
MCGIAGFSLSHRERVNANKLSSALLLGIEERGTHATGVAWSDKATNKVWIQKKAIAASQFVTNNELKGDARTAILHTRWATKGDVAIPENNHPIDVRGLVGIHNGCIFNDDALFEKIGVEKRIAQVDSEAIFANLLHGKGDTVEKLSEVKGSAAVAWLDVKNPDSLHVARISSSPMVLGTSNMGSVLFASTDRAIERGAKAVGIKITNIMRLDEGGYLEFFEGQVVQSAVFSAEKRVLSDTEKRALNLV